MDTPEPSSFVAAVFSRDSGVALLARRDALRRRRGLTSACVGVATAPRVVGAPPELAKTGCRYGLSRKTRYGCERERIGRTDMSPRDRCALPGRVDIELMCVQAHKKEKR